MYVLYIYIYIHIYAYTYIYTRKYIHAYEHTYTLYLREPVPEHAPGNNVHDYDHHQRLKNNNDHAACHVAATSAAQRVASCLR